ncbi:MAG TPA: hypothetical protein DEQ47_15605 [Solibacterales bacterium]|nr:hypothetical protein [Bryobacterales bacterium]
MKSTNQPPAHLTAAGKKLWKKIEAEIELDEPAYLLLQTLVESHDRMHQAREILARDGILVEDRFGVQRAHPCIQIERDSAAALMRAYRYLGLDLQQPVSN